MIVATYNVFHCAIPETGKVDYDFYGAIIKKLGADVVALQEVDKNTRRSKGLNQVKELAKRAGYSYWAFGRAFAFQNGGYGVGLISKGEILDDLLILLGKKDGEPRVMLTVALDLGGKKVRVASTHLGLTDADRKLQSAEIGKFVDAETLPFILGGDLNAKPGHSSIKAIGDRLTYATDKLGGIDHVLYRGDFRAEGAKVVDDNNGDHEPVVVSIT